MLILQLNNPVTIPAGLIPYAVKAPTRAPLLTLPEIDNLQFWFQVEESLLDTTAVSGHASMKLREVSGRLAMTTGVEYAQFIDTADAGGRIPELVTGVSGLKTRPALKCLWNQFLYAYGMTASGANSIASINALDAWTMVQVGAMSPKAILACSDPTGTDLTTAMRFGSNQDIATRLVFQPLGLGSIFGATHATLDDGNIPFVAVSRYTRTGTTTVGTGKQRLKISGATVDSTPVTSVGHCPGGTNIGFGFPRQSSAANPGDGRYSKLSLFARYNRDLSDAEVSALVTHIEGVYGAF